MTHDPHDEIDEDELFQEADEAIKLMQKGDANDRVRIIFWDPWERHFIGITPETLLTEGAPFNSDVQKYLYYNSTQIAQA